MNDRMRIGDLTERAEVTLRKFAITRVLDFFLQGSVKVMDSITILRRHLLVYRK